MRVFRLQNVALALSLLAVAGFVANTTVPVAYAQSNISGDIVGTVTDATGAILPGAQVKVTSLSTSQTKVVTSNPAGDYRVSLLAPGRYKVSITAPGFETTTQDTVVSAGTITQVSVKLTVGQASTTVEVSGGAIQTLHTEDAQLSTSFDLQHSRTCPTPAAI
jgi:hypothetical protein